MKNVIGLSSFPSILNLIAGLKDNKPTLKVFLSHEDKKAFPKILILLWFPANLKKNRGLRKETKIARIVLTRICENR